MEFLEKWITFWYRAHLIVDSKMFHVCNFNEKKDHPKLLSDLWSVYDDFGSAQKNSKIHFTQLGQFYHFTTWWTLYIKILLRNPGFQIQVLEFYILVQY